MPIALGLAIGIAIGISLLMTGVGIALQMLFRPKLNKGDINSPTYSFSGMQNSITPGSPTQVPYGDNKVPPAIINWLTLGHEGTVKTDILCSFGEGTIAGIRDIKINDEFIGKYFNSRTEYKMFMTHGEPKQKVYKFIHKRVHTQMNSVGTISIGLDKEVHYTKTSGVEQFATASQIKPQYVLCYLVTPGGRTPSEDELEESYQFLRYTGGPTQVSGSHYKLTGCTVYKTIEGNTTNYAYELLQLYELDLNKDGTTKEIIPIANKTITRHADLGTNLLYNTTYEYTTTNKVNGFGLVFEFPSGLYDFEKDSGYDGAQIQLRVKYKKTTDSWGSLESTVESEIQPDHTDYLNIQKNNSWANLADSNGIVIRYDSQEEAEAAREWEDIQEGDMITFQTPYNASIYQEYKYVIEKFSYIVTYGTRSDGSQGERYHGRIYFSKSLRGNKSKVYTGKSALGVDYTLTRNVKKTTNTIVLDVPKSPNVFLQPYQCTYWFPDILDDGDDDLDYAQYDIRITKLTVDKTDVQKGVNTIQIKEISEATHSRFSYPNEALLGMRLTMNENLNGSVDNITAIIAGKKVKDVTQTYSSYGAWNAGTSYSVGSHIAINGYRYTIVKKVGSPSGGRTIPTFIKQAGALVHDGTSTNYYLWEEDSCRWSDNAIDQVSDIILSSRYGRGYYLGLSDTELSEYYTQVTSEAQYLDHIITEGNNGRKRKRFSTHVNVDFPSPIIDLVQSILKCVRGFVYWNGTLPISYIDRWRSPKTLFNNANIVPNSFKISTISLDDQINRFNSSYLEKTQDYEQTAFSWDYEAEQYSARTLVQSDVFLFALTDEWRVMKILQYLTRTSKLIPYIGGFKTSLDACFVNIGEVFVLANADANWGTSGIITGIDVPGNKVTLDREVSYTNGQTIIFRFDDGTVPLLNGDLRTYTISGTGTGDELTLVESLPVGDVVQGSLYTFGTGSDYYKLYVCLNKKDNGNETEIICMPYNINVFKGLYSNDPVTQEDDGTVTPVETPFKVSNKLNDLRKLPPNVKDVVIKNILDKPGSIIVSLLKDPNPLWSQAQLYVREVGQYFWKLVGISRGEPIQFDGLTPSKVYELKVLSLGANGKINPSPLLETIDITSITGSDVNTDVPPVHGLRETNKGNSTDIFGSTFDIEWDAVSRKGDTLSRNSFTHSSGYVDEGFRYVIEIRFTGIPNSVLIGSKKANTLIASTKIQSDTKFSYSVQNNIEDTKDLFASSTSSPYYGNPQRTVTFDVTTVDAHGNQSETKSLTLTNLAPDMRLGLLNQTSSVTRNKSGLKYEWKHPRGKYDIISFLVQVDTVNTFNSVDLMSRLVPSIINVDSSDEDINAAYYAVTFENLDPKKTYFSRTFPNDPFGRGTASGTTSGFSPGLTHDDDETTIDKPLTPTNLNVTIATATSRDLRITWDDNGENDLKTGILEVRYSTKLDATIQPSITEIGDGVLSTGEDCKATAIYITSQSLQAFPEVYIFANALPGWKYWFRLRLINSSELSSDWSHDEEDTWATHSDSIPGVSSDDMSYDFKKFIFTGTFTSTDTDTVSWSSGTLKFKKSDGNTENYSINSGNTGNMSADGGWIVWPGDAPNANTKFKYVTAIGASQTAMAFCKPDTNSAFFAAFSDTKEFKLTRSLISAGAVIAQHISTSSLSAISANMGTLNAGKIQLSDSNDVRIYIDGDASTPVIRITKDGYEADSETNPDNLLFSSTYDYLKIEESGWTQLDPTTFASKNVSARSYDTSQFLYVDTAVGITSKRVVVANVRSSSFSAPADHMNVIKCDSDGIAFEIWRVYHQLDGGGDGQILILREMFNQSSVTVTFPATDANDYVYWALTTETQD